MHKFLRHRFVIGCAFALMGGCSKETLLDKSQWGEYVCKTSMSLADGRALAQEFSINLQEDKMKVKLRQSQAGDDVLESYVYTTLAGEVIEGKNPKGVTATLKGKKVLQIRMAGSSALIAGTCGPESP